MSGMTTTNLGPYHEFRQMFRRMTHLHGGLIKTITVDAELWFCLEQDYFGQTDILGSDLRKVEDYFSICGVKIYREQPPTLCS